MPTTAPIYPPTATRVYLRDWMNLGHTVALVPAYRYPCGCDVRAPQEAKDRDADRG